jgi:hypothetical protein
MILKDKRYNLLFIQKLPFLTVFQRLKSALWYSIGKIIDDESLESNVNATPQYIGALTELVWTQLGRFWFSTR